MLPLLKRLFTLKFVQFLVQSGSTIGIVLTPNINLFSFFADRTDIAAVYPAD